MTQLSKNSESNLSVTKYPKGWHVNVITSNDMDVVVQLVHVGGQLKSGPVCRFGGAISGLRQNRFPFPSHSSVHIRSVWLHRSHSFIRLVSFNHTFHE